MNESNSFSDDGQGNIVVSTPAANAPRPRTPRVLVVADEPLTAQVLARVLTDAGLAPDIAPSGSVALQKLPNAGYEAIYLDLTAPDLLGVDVIKEARKDRAFARRPIYVFDNSWPAGGWSQQALKAGATKVVDKLATSFETVLHETAVELNPEGRAASSTTQDGAATGEDPLGQITPKLKEKVAWLSQQLRALAQCHEDGARAAKCSTMLSHVLSLVNSAAAAGKIRLARQAAALEVFLKELYVKPKSFNDSTAHTLALTVESLESLCAAEGPDPLPGVLQVKAVVTADKFFARRSISKVLNQVGFELATFADLNQTLDHLRKHPAKLVVLDLSLPQWTESESASQLAEFARQEKIPVLVTATLRELKDASRSAAMRAFDSIQKPYLATELILKGFCLIMKNRPVSQPAPSGSTTSLHAAKDRDLAKEDTSVRLAATRTGPGSPAAAPLPAAAATAAAASPVAPVAETAVPADTQDFSAQLASPEVAVILIDENNKVTSANDVSASMFGWPKLPGNHVEVLFKDGMNNEFGRILQQPCPRGNSTERFTFRTLARGKGGPEFPVSVILTRNSVGAKTSWTAVFRKLEANAELENDGHTAFMRSATTELQKQCQSLADESHRFREELEQAVQEREQLESQLKELAAAKEALERELEGQTDKHESLETTFISVRKELDTLKKGSQSTESAYQQEIAQNERLKEELLGLRQMCEDLTQQLSNEQQSSMDANQRCVILQKQIDEAKADTKRLREEHDQQKNQPSPAETELREQLDAAQSRLQQAEAASQEHQDRAGQLESELASLRQAAEVSNASLAQEKDRAAEADLAREDLQSKFDAATAELERLQSERDSQPANTNANTNAADSLAPENVAAELQSLRDTLATHESERAELEERLRDHIASLARATAEVEKERRERKRVEQRAASLTTQLQERHEELKQHLESAKHTQDRLTDLEAQLRDHETSVSRLRTDLQKEASDRQLAEDQLEAAGDVQAQLDNYRNLLEESKTAFQRSQEDLEARLQSAQKALKESESKFEKESADRQRLESSLRTLQDQADQTAHELSKVQSQLQVEQLERKKLEGDAVHSRFSSIDSARASRTLANTLRRQIRQPVDQLLQSSRQLLELDLPDNQKALAEALFENALLVQTSLQESPSVKPEPGQPATDSPPPTSGDNQAAA